jgi:hypothetical protein
MSEPIKHRCAKHTIDQHTETLIIGTFNPDTETNPADFFYGRPHNHLWRILPKIFGEESLKGKTKEEKLKFMRAKHIDFIDLILEIDREPPDYSDKHLDKLKGIRWREDIIQEIEKLRFLKRVGVSRKKFNDVPNIGARIETIATYFQDKPIVFKCVHTPARAYSTALGDWTEFLRSQPGPRLQ